MSDAPTYGLRSAAAPLVDVARHGRLTRVPLTLAMTALVVLAAAASRTTEGAWLLGRWATEYAGMSLVARTVRLVPSLFAPASRLPAWGAAGQVAVVTGTCESRLGTRRTATVGLVGHCLATMSARMFVWIGPSVALGLSSRYLGIADTGPSAFVIALLAYLALSARSAPIGAALGLFMMWEAELRPSLAEREHLVAIAVGLLCAVVAIGFRFTRLGSSERAPAS